MGRGCILGQGVLEALERWPRRAVVQCDALHLGAGDDGAEDVDGIAGIGDGDGVLVVEHGEAEVRDALLGADGDDGLGLGSRSTS